MLLNLIAAAVLLLPLGATVFLATSFFGNMIPYTNYFAALGIILAVVNIFVQLFLMRWLLLDIIAPLAELLGFELYIEKEIIEEEDKNAAIFGAIWLFITHISMIILLFVHQMPILGFFSAFGYGVFLLGDWVMHNSTQEEN
jgi:hypothetical protein